MEEPASEPATETDEPAAETTPEAKTLVDSILDSNQATLVEAEKDEEPVANTSEENQSVESEATVASTDESDDSTTDDLEPELDEEVVEEEEAEEEKVS